MLNSVFHTSIKEYVLSLKTKGTSKSQESVIQRYDGNRAVIEDRKRIIFNSNDYLGLRFNKEVLDAHSETAEQYGVGAGSVRFISGTTSLHIELEKKLAAFHKREAAMVFSSGFAANIGVLSALLNSPKDSNVAVNVCVMSDELNHRSIIDGIRMSNIGSESKCVYRHLDYHDLASMLEKNSNKFERAIVISDGIFSMLGEPANIKELQDICRHYEDVYSQGVLLLIDDSHGVGVYGAHGRGCEEVFSAKADLLIGTLGKAFGVEGGYVVGEHDMISYLRETASTYIYSNALSPASTAAALTALRIADSEKGDSLRKTIKSTIAYLHKFLESTDITFRYTSDHPIQPLNVGDTQKTKALARFLYDKDVVVTPIMHPVVPLEEDEIRLQLSALHGPSDIDVFFTAVKAFITFDKSL